MRTTAVSRTLALLISAALIFAFGASSLLAQEAFRVAGKWTTTQVKFDTTAVGDAGGHYLSVSRFAGLNASVGSTKFMDGAQVVNVAFSDLINGIGLQRGYAMLTEGGNIVSCKWEGHVTTVMGKDGPIVSFEGTFTWSRGTGQYAGVQGTGTYRGHATSETTYDMEWSGEYTIAK